MLIRAFRGDDSARLAEIYHDAVQQVGARHYTPAQIRVWSPAPVPAAAFLKRVSDGRSVLVAADETDRPMGFIELEPDGHIDCFYCAPEIVGTGVGAALYEALEAKAREARIRRLFVEASETAQSFFLKRGFTITARRDFDLKGVMIHNYAMEKTLL